MRLSAKKGLINSDTDMADFIYKMKEESIEVVSSYYNEPFDRCIEEVSDLMTVCIMALKHHGFDPVKEFEKTLIKNENRADKLH